jgi:hypothetical protein
MVHMTNVTIFGENIESSDFSVRIIYDIELNEENFSRHHLLGDEAKKPYLRWCGVKFHSLSRAQQDSLNMYIHGLDIKPELSN